MDVVLCTYFMQCRQQKKDKKTENFNEEESIGVSIASMVIGLLIGIYAVYLSWSCNTAAGVSTGLKILFAFFAFLFGTLYLIFYLLVRAGRCAVA